MKTAPLPSEELIGSFRRFGTEGPVYEVIAQAGHDTIRILVVETGETLDYSTEKALRDPEAA